MTTLPPARTFAVLVLVVALGAASCGNGDAAAPPLAPSPAVPASLVTTTQAATTTLAPPTTAAATTTTTTSAPPTTLAPPTTSDPFAGPPTWDRFEPDEPFGEYAALTGRPLDQGGDPSSAVLAVKVDNHPQSRPQTGLDQADVVFEEDVEGITRFVALYHSVQPEMIGPVRSVRTSDLPILAALNRPILLWSGGNPYVERSVSNAAQAGLLIDEGHPAMPGCYRRGGRRAAPHNLYVDPACARGAVGGAGPARPLWSFGPLPAEVAAQPIGSFTVPMEGVNVTWSWDAGAGRYLRSQAGRAHVTTTGQRVGAENVLVMTVEYARSPADHRSPDARTVGSGPVVVHREGTAVAGTWHRENLTSPYRFTDPSGAPIPLAPGTTFVLLAR